MEKRRPSIISEKDFARLIPDIVTGLEAVRETDMLPSFDGVRLYCERYLAPSARGNIVIVHGFTEFAEKYKEMIRYYLDLGLNVIIYDQRGHGLSDREVDDLRRIHVPSFDCYVKDLETVIEQLCQPRDLPLHLFSHSMGGAISALYMLKHPTAVGKAVLSAPMISPKTHGVPRFLVLLAAGYCGKKQGWDARFPHTGEFDPNVKLENTNDDSRTRFNWALQFRLCDERYQTSASTNRWMWEAVKVKDAILNGQVKNIETEVLILSAELDTVVKNGDQRSLAKKLKNCRFVTIEGSKHNIFFSHEKVIRKFYSEIFDFLSEN